MNKNLSHFLSQIVYDFRQMYNYSKSCLKYSTELQTENEVSDSRTTRKISAWKTAYKSIKTDSTDCPCVIMQPPLLIDARQIGSVDSLLPGPGGEIFYFMSYGA